MKISVDHIKVKGNKTIKNEIIDVDNIQALANYLENVMTEALEKDNTLLAFASRIID